MPALPAPSLPGSSLDGLVQVAGWAVLVLTVWSAAHIAVLHLLRTRETRIARGLRHRLAADLLADPAAPGAADRAARWLHSRAGWRRGRAVAFLGGHGGPGDAPALVPLLSDRSLHVRCAAARALGRLGGADAVRALLAGLAGDHPLPAGVVGTGVLEVGPAALPVLRRTLDEAPGPARALAAELLGLHADPLAGPALLRLLTDDGECADVRRAAATALGRIGSPQATAALLRVLSGDDDAELRAAAATALGAIGDRSAVPALAAGLADVGVLPATAAACARALADIAPEGRDVLRALAGSTGPRADFACAALDAAGIDLLSGARR